MGIFCDGSLFDEFLLDDEGRQSDLDPVGEQSSKSRWPVQKMCRCKSKWSDGLELLPLFVTDEKDFSGERRGGSLDESTWPY